MTKLLNENAIAVIGLSFRFPAANNLQQLADVIYQKMNAITETPKERWSLDEFPKARFGGFIQNIDQFDADFFGISSDEAKAMDPQQRLLLEVSFEAFESAGLSLETLSGSNTGVFVGLSTDDYSRIQQYDIDNLDVYLSTANAKSIAANRISYCFNLQGASVAIDTACSSSLVAIHQACLSLRSGESELALAAGVNLMLNPAITINLAEGGMLAKDGRCKVFDASADGYVRGEGVGVVVLKRYQEAVRDKDPIFAVILGSACNQDGASNGITAPNGLAQEKVIEQALSLAKVSPDAIQYVEAHGTGTSLGDPIEVAALATVLGQGRQSHEKCAVGSIKTNIGHLEAAAGIAGFIKTLLVLQKQLIPPSLHLTNINSAITHAEKDILYFPTETMTLSGGQSLQYASVSSFGFGGTNVHVVLGRAPVTETISIETSAIDKLFVMSAATLSALRQRVAQYQTVCEVSKNSAIPAYLFNHRSHFDCRLAVVAKSNKEAALSLSLWLDNQEVAHMAAGERQFDKRLVWVFSGQGGQYLGMGSALLQEDEIFHQAVMECDAIIATERSWSVSHFLRYENNSTVLAKARYAQPLQVVVQIALGRWWLAKGIKPAAIIGHSLGELPAAYFSGALTLRDTLQLAIWRGEAMEQCYDENHGMLNCRSNIDVLLPLLQPFKEKVTLAVFNSRDQLVVSGDKDTLTHILQIGEKNNIRCRWVDVDAAFHSSAMKKGAEVLANQAKCLIATFPNIPLYSTLTGTKVTDHDLTSDYWAKQIISPVQFVTGIEQLLQDGYKQFLEIGPHPILFSAMQSIMAEQKISGLVLGSLQQNQPEMRKLLSQLGRLYVQGFEIKIPDERPDSPIDLPAYPWQDQHYWFENSLKTKTIPQKVVEPIPASKEEILQEIMTKIGSMLGLSVNDMQPLQPFIEMGTDSIVMAKAIADLEKRFNVSLTLRQFFEELSTPDALAQFLFERVPWNTPDRQLNTLQPRDDKNIYHGPYRGTLSHQTVDYSITQQVYLEHFIQRYTEKTPLSKMSASVSRKHLADSRASAGFRPSIKELLYPILGKESSGSRLWDIDGNEYIDISMDFGVNLFGHQASFIISALQAQLQQSLALAPRSKQIGETAKLLCDITGMERALFCTTGTEAVMTALRLARLATGRQKIVMFAYSYHGHADGVLAKATEESQQSEPVVSGIPFSAVADTLVLSYDDPDALRIIANMSEQIAAVLVEPVQARRPSLQPKVFLQKLRQLTKERQIILIFDEMITGFRLCPGGAQQWFNVKADLATYGKILGGGCPVAAVAGSADLLAGIDGGWWEYHDNSYPQSATTFFAGTFNGNALGLAAAHAVLSAIKKDNGALQKDLNLKTEYLATTLNHWFDEEKLALKIVYCGSLFRFEFKTNLDILFYHLLERGLFIWEGRNCFLSAAHTDKDIESIINIIKQTVKTLKQTGLISSRERVPLSLAQKQLWAVCQLSKEANIAYQEASLLPLDKEIHIPVLELAFCETINRHEALRTSLSKQGDHLAIAAHVAFELQQCDISVFPETEQAQIHQQWLDALLSTPFDLAKAPLLRAGISKSMSGEYTLVLVVHHIIADGWSFGVILKEVFALYQSLMTDAPLPQKPLLQLSDYNHWLNAHVPTMQIQRDYWAKQIKALPQPLFEAAVAEEHWSGSQIVLSINHDKMKVIQDFAKTHQTSLFMVLLAFYQSFLHRRFNRDDIIVGCPTLGRSLQGAESLVAYCTHLLPIRSQGQLTDSFSNFLNHTKQTVLSALDHQDYPFAHMLEDRVDAKHESLIQTVFNIDKTELEELMPATISAANFPLSLHVLEKPNHLAFLFKYQDHYFNQNSITELSDQFMTWMENCLHRPEETLNNISLFPKSDWQKMAAWNDNTVTYSQSDIDTLFKLQVSRYKDEIALQVEQEKLTYEELNKLVTALAIQISHKKIAKKEEIVAISLDKRADTIVAMLAVLRSGAAFLVLDKALPQNRLQLLLENSECQLVVTNQVQQTLFAPLVKRMVFVENIRAPLLASEFPFPPISPQQLAYLVFTSGSTGAPKGVMIEHQSFVNFAYWLGQQVHLTKGVKIDCSANLSFDFGLATSLAAWLLGATVVVCEDDVKKDMDLYWQYIEENEINILKLTPSYFRLLLLQAERYPKTLASLKTIILAGEKINSADCHRWLKQYPHHQLINCYGPTETTVSVLMHPVLPHEHNIPLGKPQHNIKSYILNSQHEMAAMGVIGELAIGGDCLARGYLKEPELTAARFIHLTLPDGTVSRLYLTGDQAKWTTEGEIEYCGRNDEQVKIRGFRVELNEIATLLRQYPGVDDVAVTLQDQKITVHYVSSDQSDLSLALKSYLAENLPEYMLPSWYILVTSIPLNRNYKLDKKALPSPEISGSPRLNASQPRDDDSKPSSPIQAILISAWQEVLNIPHVNSHDNFFGLGGDSISVILLVAKLRGLGYKISAKQIYETKTLAELANEIKQETEFASQAAIVGSVLLTPIQSRFFAKQLANIEHYNQAIVFETRQPLKKSLLQKALQHIISLHDGLRFRFKKVGLDWQQYVVDMSEAESIIEEHNITLEQTEDFYYYLQSEFNLTQGPLIKIALLRFSANHTEQLFIAIHHLLIDAVSWQVLLFDLFQAYEALLANQTIKLMPKTHSYQEWAKAYEHYIQQAVVQKNYWVSQLLTHSRKVPGLIKNTKIYTESLGTQLTSSLLAEMSLIYDAHINALLLSALFLSFQHFTGQSELAVMLEGHGREEAVSLLDYSRTIGWFTSIFPIKLRGSSTESSLVEIVHTVDATLKAIPDRGVGYGALRDLQKDADLRRLYEPDIGFNYLGQTILPGNSGQYLLHGSEPSGTIALHNRANYNLEINAAVVSHELIIHFKSSQENYDDILIRDLATQYSKTLKYLIEYGQMHLSSLLSKDELDKIIHEATPDEVIEIF